MIARITFISFVVFLWSHFFCCAMENGNTQSNGKSPRNGILSPRAPLPLVHSAVPIEQACVKTVTFLLEEGQDQMSYSIRLKKENVKFIKGGSKKKKAVDIVLHKQHLEKLVPLITSQFGLHTTDEVSNKDKKIEEQSKKIVNLEKVIDGYKTNPTLALEDHRSFAERHVKLISFLSVGLGAAGVGAAWLFFSSKK